MATRAPGTDVHLLEAVLRWPPETFIDSKIRSLAARGIRVTVATDAARRGAADTPPGVTLTHLPHWDEPRWRSAIGVARFALVLLVRDPGRLRRLVTALRRPRAGSATPTPWPRTMSELRRALPLALLRPDIVHFEWETAAARMLPLTEVWGCPVVVSTRGREIHVYTRTWADADWVALLPETFSRAAAVHCVSDAIRDECASYGLDPGKARVIRPAVDTEFFTPATAKSPDSPVLRVVAVSDLLWMKGYEYALQAIAMLRERGVPVRLDVVGHERPDLPNQSGNRDRILGTVADLGLAAEVRMHGRLEPAAVRTRLRRSDVLLHASLAEGIPNSVLEAMACGIPVVVTDSGGTAEAVTDGREGFVLAPRDSAAMAAALERLWHDRDLRERMGRAARARVESAFALDRQVSSIVAMYDEVLAQPEEAAR
jgi:colanic acid/amylovoran biosynthesis glycosyltransferase